VDPEHHGRCAVDIQITFVGPELAEAIAASQRETSARIAEAIRLSILEMMDTAFTTVLTLGYRSEELLIEIDRLPSGGERRMLKVLGVPCFEVTVDAPIFDVTPPRPAGYTIDVTTMPRVIAWPKARA
jgi:hypothetical protein